jgi:hypothetical protein
MWGGDVGTTETLEGERIDAELGGKMFVLGDVSTETTIGCADVVAVLEETSVERF